MTRIVIFLSALCLMLSAASPAAVIHVPADQSTIQAGINAAVSGDTVLVAPGTWTGPDNTNLTFSSNQITLQSEDGPATCTIDCQGGSQPGLDIWAADIVLRGFTITGSSGDGVESWFGLTMEDCVISGHGGSGLLFEFGAPTMTGCTISGNGAYGIFGYDYNDAYLTDCTITGNGDTGIWVSGATMTGCTITYNYGGGIYLDSGGSVSDSTILGNSNAGMHGGGICSWGTVHLTNCQILGNYASEAQGWGEGGGIWYVYGSPVITGCTISGNQSDRGGGGIGTSENHMGRAPGRGAQTGLRAATISGNLITGNRAPESAGGAIYCDGMGQMNLTNNLIAGNRSEFAPIYNYSSNSMTIRGCTIAGNQATGSAVSVGGVYSTRPLVVENSILWNNISSGGAQAGISNGTLTVSYSDLQGGQAGVYLGSGGVLDWGTGMIDADPSFAEGLTHDYYIGQVAAGQPVDSPCLDVGTAAAADICYSAPGGTACLDELTTRSDHQWADLGQADLGYHPSFLPGLEVLTADLTCLPAMGQVPFDLSMGVSLTNQCPLLNRRVAGRINLTLGNGQFYSSWRAGWTNLGPLESYQASWIQTIPDLGPVLGENIFTLLAEDVTPAPYNQVPYPPSGSVDGANCQVLAVQDAPPVSSCENSVLVASELTTVIDFGAALAIDHDILLVGAPRDNEAGVDSGAAYVYRRGGLGWSEGTRLTIAEAANWSDFGYAAAVGPDFVLVGAPGLDTVYRFSRTSEAWPETAQLTPAAADAYEFGSSLSLDGGQLAVGAPRSQIEAYGAGSVHLFRLTGSFWVEEAVLTAADAAINDDFGRSVHLAGDRLIVGAPREESTSTGTGAAYVFRYENDAWVEEEKLVPGDAEDVDRFGYSVCISGDIAVVGSLGDDDLGAGSGSVYLFQRSGTSWSQITKLNASDGAEHDNFGRSMAFDGTVLLVGAPLHDGPGGNSSGAVYFFHNLDGSWVESEKVVHEGSAVNAHLGWAVGLHDDLAALGAPDEEVGLDQPGVVHVRAISGDCNVNGVADICDILHGTSLDENRNRIPDECEP
jgi:hypothetical protein